MATSAFLSGRQYYGRPQAILFSDNPGTIQNEVYVPDGVERENFIILPDHNREPISFTQERIENRVRTINGRMRSYHIADKLNISVTWENLPSRSASSRPVINEQTGQSSIGENDLFYTVDKGAGAVDILNWYENNKGSFWVFLAYDKFNNFENDEGVEDYTKMNQYNEIIEVFFSEFDYEVVKRGQGSHDFWNINLTLEEV